ncbi:hypothetical protein [Rathayibacter sp. AY1D9]|uniref:hypothetical protein n=1 Tax=Rathayibacter sp. AY1D9 TaxID=2080548 RepID=UPI000CE89D1F|nr:hypothetical protein [Rathayibacter sp. AY1D9]PPH83898.1 hypothetical protein C5C50_04155 [Rathayibacter sp. AY1D9]
MATYAFQVKMTIYGEIEREIGDDDPETYAAELEDEMPSTNDLTFIRNDEIEIDDWVERKI